MKPSWDDAPEWAQWLARSAGDDGWTWFEKKPVRDEQRDYIQVPHSKWQEAICYDPSLEERPNV